MKRQMNVTDMVKAALFCALMVVGAKVSIQTPIPSVPLTFQGFFAVLAGLLLGSKIGFLSQVVYLLMGLVGLPVFSGPSAGPEYVLKPTFGFLLGFAGAAWLAGKLTEKSERSGILRIAVAAFSGLFFIYGVGVLYLYAVRTLYLSASVTLFAVAQSMIPFLIKDAVLFALAVVLAVRLIPALKRTGRYSESSKPVL